MAWGRSLAALGLILALLGGPAAAQDSPQSPILTIDQDRLFAESAFGARVRQELNEASAALAAENRTIEAELIAEEQELTDRRAELPAEEFRALADAFDEKVQQIRAEQDGKSRGLARRDEAEKQRFFGQIAGILGAIARERGAVAIIERRTIFLAADSIDVTDLAIARIDEAMGDGGE